MSEETTTETSPGPPKITLPQGCAENKPPQYPKNDMKETALWYLMRGYEERESYQYGITMRYVYHKNNFITCYSKDHAQTGFGLRVMHAHYIGKPLKTLCN